MCTTTVQSGRSSRLQADEMKAREKKTLVIAQEIKIARLLANNDKRIRDKVLKRLRKWLTVRSQSSFEFTETDFMSLWKGLFYCMWMSDTLLVQESLAESISTLVHCFESMSTIVLYTSCALTTLATEWTGLDHYRINKFAMLTRRILRQTFLVCRDKLWDTEWVTSVSKVFEKLFLNPKTNLGFNLHVIGIYLEELAKIADGDIPQDAVHQLINPFTLYLITSRDDRPIRKIMQCVFRYLIFQSDVGMDYTEKFEVWKNAGFPCVSVDDVEKVEVSEESEGYSDDEDEALSSTGKKESKPLDPRAGRVDVELPQLPFDAAKIAQSLQEHVFHASSNAKSRRQLRRLIEEFKDLAEERMPLGVKKVRKPSARKSSDMNARKVALRLIQYEKDIVSEKLSRKRKKQKKNRQAIVVAADKPENENTSESSSANVVEYDAPENGTIDGRAVTAKTNSSADAPSRKRKRGAPTRDEGCARKKREIAERSFKEQKSEGQVISDNTTQGGKNKGIQLKRKNSTHTADTRSARLKRRAMTREETSDDGPRYTCGIGERRAASRNQEAPKRTKSKSMLERSVGKMSGTQDDRAEALESQLANTIREQELDKSSAKKKVVFRLYRNTAQHTSEYLQQIRRSPAIPFDANRKPLPSVLKTSPLSNPINPFYKNKSALRNQRI